MQSFPTTRPILLKNSPPSTSDTKGHVKLTEVINIKKRKEDIIALWNEAFGDSREYIEFFLCECPDIVCLGDTEGGRLASMLFLLNGNIGQYPCKYLYAACTLKQFRGRGLMGELIEYAKKYCVEAGFDFIFLVPGEEGLYSYYKKFGFEPKFQKSVYNFTLNSGDFSLKEIDDTELIAQKRNELLGGCDCFCFDIKTTQYTAKEFLHGGGKVYFAEEGEALAFASGDGKNCVIKELLSKKAENLTFNLHLFKNLGKENIYIHTPIVYNSRNNGSECTKCGMLYPLTQRARLFSEAHGTLYAGMYLD